MNLEIRRCFDVTTVGAPGTRTTIETISFPLFTEDVPPAPYVVIRSGFFGLYRREPDGTLAWMNDYDTLAEAEAAFVATPPDRRTT